MKTERPSVGRLKKVISDFHGKRVLVIGDLMLDEYIYGRTDRISREAPVLILAFNGSVLTPGGAANACANINSLSAVAVPVGVVGNDESGGTLIQLLKDHGISTHSIASSESFETIQKTRILAGGFHCAKQQVIRIDRGKRAGIRRKVEDSLIERASALVPSVDAVLFSDYGYGAVSPRLRTEITGLARARRRVLCADSRFDLVRFKGATVATPNEAEAGPAAGVAITDDATLHIAGKRLLARMGLKSLIITQGSSGMTVFENRKAPVRVPIFGSDEIADVTGAGDTVAAAVSLSLSSGASIVEAACIATYAGSVVVMKRGTAVATSDELMEAVSRGRIGILGTLQ